MIDNKNNQNSTAKSYLVNVGGKTEVWDEATYTELKDALYSKYPDANMFELDNMTDFSAVDDEMQYVVNIGDRTETWDAATMKELGSALKEKYPNATVQSLKYKDYWYDKALADEESLKTMQGELEALNKELGGKQRWSPEYSAIESQINDKRGQMAQAKSSYDANPRVVEANERYEAEQAAALEEYKKNYLPNLRNTFIKWAKDDVDLREVAKEDRIFNMDPLTGEPQFASLKDIKSIKKGDGLVARHKMEQYLSAFAFLNKAERIRNEHSSFGEGMKNTAMNWVEAWGSQSDIKTYQEIYVILKRLEDKFGRLDELSEEDLKANLTKSEQALILAFFEYTSAQAEIQDDASWIYEAGGIAAEAIPFMLEFIATGGLSSAAGKVATKGLSKAMTSWIKSATKGTLKRTARKVVAKGVRGTVRGLTQAAVITPLRPTAYTNVMKSMTQIDKDGKLKDSGSDIAIAIADEYIETLSELSGGAITSVLGGVGKGAAKKFLSKGMYDTFSTWGKKLSNMSGVKLAKSAQFHGLPVEMSEEYFGNALREMYDAKALDKMHEGDNFWSMLVGFLPMTVITGGMGVGQYLNAKNKVNKGAARLGDILAKEGYKDDQIEAVVALAQEVSPYSLSEKLDPILTSMTKAGASKESRDAVIKYAMDVVRYKTLEGTVNAPESTKRQKKLDELTGKFGTFYQTKNEGTKWQEKNVTTAKLNNGSIAFLTSVKNEAGEFDAIDINTGNKIRITESDIASVKDKNGNDVVLMSTRPLNTYLTELVMAERQKTIADYEAAYNNGQEMTVADLSYLNEQEQKAKENLLNTGIASRENSFTGESLNLSSDELLTLSEQEEFTEEESNAIRELAIVKRTNEGLIDKLKQPIISSIDSRNSIASNASNNGTLTVGTHNGKTVYVKGGVQTSNGKIVKPDNTKGHPVEIVDAATGEVSVVDSKELTNVGNVNTDTWNRSYEVGMMKAFDQKIEELRNATSPNEILAEVSKLIGKKVYLNINDNITLVEVDQILPSMEVLIKGKKGDLGSKSVLAVGIDEFYNMIYRDANGKPVLPNEEQESEVADYRGETVSILINGVPTSVEVVSQDNSSDTIVYEYTENGNTKRGRSTISEFGNAIEQANEYVHEQPSVQEETPVAETQEQPTEENVSEKVVVEESAEAPVENAPLDPESINWDELFEQDKEAYFVEMQNQFGEEAVDVLNEEIDAAQRELDALGKAKTKSQNDRIKNRNKKKALQSRIDALNEMVARLTTPAETSPVAEVTEETPAEQEIAEQPVENATNAESEVTTEQEEDVEEDTEVKGPETILDNGYIIRDNKIINPTVIELPGSPADASRIFVAEKDGKWGYETYVKFDNMTSYGSMNGHIQTDASHLWFDSLEEAIEAALHYIDYLKTNHGTYKGKPNGSSGIDAFVKYVKQSYLTEQPSTPVADTPAASVATNSVADPVAEAKNREERLLSIIERKGVSDAIKRDSAFNAGKEVGNFFATYEEYEAYEAEATDFGEYNEDFERGVKASFANREQSTQYHIGEASTQNDVISEELGELVAEWIRQGGNFVVVDKAQMEHELSNDSSAKTLETPDGVVYGFVKDGVVCLNPSLINPNTAIHEYTHLWDNALMQLNPELWAKGKALMKQTPIWDEVLNDPNYADIKDNEDLVASEVHSRLVGERGAERLNQLEQQAREEGLTRSAKKLSILGRLRKWLNEATKWLKSAFAQWNNSEIESIELSDFLDMPLSDLANFTQFTIGNNAQTDALNSKQTKEPGGMLTDEQLGINQIQFSISKNNRATIDKWLGMRSDLSEAEKNAFLLYIDNREPVQQLAMARWFSKGAIRLPEDLTAIDNAFKFARKMNVDPMKYDTPAAVNKDYVDRFGEEKKEDSNRELLSPDDARFEGVLTNKVDYGNGIVVYDVQNDIEHGQRAVRDLMNDHLGADFNCWCLLYADSKGNPNKGSREMWWHYNKTQKKVAFKDGKICAFCASTGRSSEWWDLHDQSHGKKIPVEAEVEGDKLGRRALCEFDGKNISPVKNSPMYRGNKKNGLYEEWDNSDPNSITLRTTRKGGKDNGTKEMWDGKGNLTFVGRFKNGNAIGEHTGYASNGQVVSKRTYDKNGALDGEVLKYAPNGTLLSTGRFVHGKPVGKHLSYHENGRLMSEKDFQDGHKVGYETEYNKKGKLVSRKYHDMSVGEDGSTAILTHDDNPSGPIEKYEKFDAEGNLLERITIEEVKSWFKTRRFITISKDGVIVEYDSKLGVTHYSDKAENVVLSNEYENPKKKVLYYKGESFLFNRGKLNEDLVDEDSVGLIDEAKAKYNEIIQKQEAQYKEMYDSVSSAINESSSSAKELHIGEGNLGENSEAQALALDAVMESLDGYVEVEVVSDVKNKDNMEPLQTPNGTVYGWTDGKKIYLTKAGFNPNTPIHEYTHLWAKAMMQKNPKGWNSVKSLLKNTPIWDEVINDPNYSNIKDNEDAVASEALSRLSGSQNAAKMEQMAQQMIDEAKGTMRKAEARGLIQNMKDALAKFWNWVGTNLFKIEKFNSVEQVTDRVLWDLLNKTDLGELREGKTELQVAIGESSGISESKKKVELADKTKTADSDRSGVISGTTSSTSLPLGGKQHLSTHHLTHQESDANLRTNFETIKRKVQKFINSGYEIKDKHKIHDETQLVQKLASIFGFEKSETSISYYGEYETSIDIDGKKYKVRLSNHKASGEWMSKGEFDERVSLVIESKDTEGREGGDKYFVEYVTDLKGNHTIEEVTKVITDSVFSLLNGGKVERSLFDEYNKRNLSAKVRDIEAEMQKIKDAAIADGTFMKAPNGKSTKLTERQWLLVRTESFKDWFGDWEYNPEEASKVVDENGEPMVVYHGSPYGAITEFDRKGHSVSGLREFGTYFCTSKELAQLYAYARQQAKGDVEKYELEKARLDAIIFDNETPARIALDAFDELDRLEESQKPRVYEVFLNIRKPKVFDAERSNGWDGWHKLKQDVGYDIKSGVEAIEAISGHNSAASMDEAYDGIIAENMADVHSEEGLEELMGDVFLVFDETPSNIKSATDNVGTFDADDPDIRYRKAEAQNAAVGYLAGEPRLRAIENAVNEEASKLGVTVTYKTRSEMPKGHENDKGYYNTKTGEIVICTENNASIADAIQTILHEAVAHNGLRQLMGDKFNEFINRVYNSLDAETKAKVDALAAESYNGNTAVAMEEYMASLAENENFAETSIWEKIKSIFENIINSILGRNDIQIGDKELRYILRASYNNMVNPNTMNTIEGWAKDTNMRNELGINEATPEIMSRTGIDATEVASESAKQVYDKVVREGWQEFQRQFQDAYQPVRIAIEAIQQETGNIPVEDYENYLLIQNQTSSRSRVEIDNFERKYYEPIIEQVNNIVDMILEARGMKNNKKNRAEVYAEVRQYMIAKHGLERNKYYQEHKTRPLNKEEKELARKNIEQDYADELARIASNYTGSERKSQEALAKQKYEAQIEGISSMAAFDVRDYSGLTSLFGLDPSEFEEAEMRAQDVVDEFEKELGRVDDKTSGKIVKQSAEIDALWNKINSATDKTLRHSYESGMISRQQYDQIRSMFNFYIPLRGFDETTAEDVYSYARFEGNRFNAAVQKAEGRTSVADDPIATIMNMAESEIAQGNKNRAKQALYNYLLNRAQGKEKQNSLMQVEDVWYVITKDENGNDVYSIASPNHEAGETWEEFENRMSTLEAEEKAVKSKKGQVDVGMRFQKKRNQNAHYIYLKINGVDKAIYINGDPKAADAVNGTYKQNRHFGEDKFRQINRLVSSTFTNYSLEFTARNFFRDMFYSHINMGIKEKDPAYRKTFRKNWRSNNMGTMLKMLKAYRAGEYDNKSLNASEASFVEFMANGGQTGYTLINSVESHKQDLEKSLERIRKGSRNGGLKNSTVFKYTLGAIELLNEASELVTRFAAFKTSRDMGRSVVESINDAKEITVNFNTKGAQDGTGWMGAIARYFGWSKYFFNASVQGVQNLKAMADANKLKFCGVVGGMMGLGFLMPVITSAIASMLGGDDDEYWNIPEYDRQNNLCICIGGGNYIKIPLPIGFREIYAMGDMTSALAFDKRFSRDIWSVGMDYANKIASLTLPINPLEGSANGLSIWNTFLSTALPSSFQFAIQNATNTDWKGAPLQKEYTWNEDDPQWMKAFENAPDWMVGLSKWCNENINLDGDYRGLVDWSPEKLDNTLSNLFGGVYTLIKKTGNSISAAWNEEERNLSNIPLAGVVFGTGIESDGRFVTDAYFNMKDYYDSNVNRIKRVANNFGLSLEDIFVKQKGAHHPKVQEIYGNKNFEWMKDWYLGHEGNRKAGSKAEKLGLNQLKQDIKDLQKSIAEREERGMSTEKKQEKLIEKQKMFDEYYRDFTYRLLEMD